MRTHQQNPCILPYLAAPAVPLSQYFPLRDKDQGSCAPDLSTGLANSGTCNNMWCCKALCDADSRCAAFVFGSVGSCTNCCWTKGSPQLLGCSLAAAIGVTTYFKTGAPALALLFVRLIWQPTAHSTHTWGLPALAADCCN